MRNSIRNGWIALLGSVLAACASLSLAQEFPARPVRVIVPFAAGSSVDTVARIVANDLTARLKVPVLVENRPGATGGIGSELVAKAPPDGYTLLMGTTGTNAANPSIYPNLGYSPLRDFAPVSFLVSQPMLVVAYPGAPFKTLPELIEYARANPGKIAFATTTAPGIVIGESIKARAKVDIMYVPYKNSLGAINDVIGGQLPLMVTDSAVGTPQVKAGKLRGIAATSAKPTSLLPDVPTVAATLPGFEVITWFGLFAPAATPSAVVDKLASEVQQILQDPAMRNRLVQLGFEMQPMTTAQFRTFLREEIERWAVWVKEFGIGPQS
jgi:tripartite-type tricarboxylate transporter receptor subunit TctC